MRLIENRSGLCLFRQPPQPQGSFEVNVKLDLR